MKLPWTKRVAPKAPIEPAKPLTVFDMVDELHYIPDREGVVTNVFVIFKPKPANSPFQKGSDMLAAYPERKMHKDEQEYGVILKDTSAQRFYDDYEQHQAQKKADRGR